MRYLLSPSSRPVLARLARERTLCAFDFDGTLAPIVRHPGQVRLPERTRRLLAKVAALYPCVILSGRSRADLLGRLNAAEIGQVIGNHGAEAKRRREPPVVRQWKAEIESALGSLPGVWVEEKGRSLAVHYRQSPKKAGVRRKIVDATRNLKQARVFGGKQSVNVVIEGDPHKGTALAEARDRLRCDWVLYVGDDTTDEDAFAIDGHMASVRVGKKKGSRARYYLRTRNEIDELLDRLAALRRAPTNKSNSAQSPRQPPRSPALRAGHATARARRKECR